MLCYPKNFQLMNDDFAPFELAVKLKEKGFNEKCYHYYQKEVLLTEICWNRYNRGTANRCSAPTISQVLKWLREEKKIYIVIAVNPTLSTKDKIAYYYQVYSNSNGVTSDYYESEECYAQWEDCTIDSIKYVLDNLI